MREVIELLAIFIVIGTVGAESASDNFVPYENPTTIETKNLTFNMDQSVSGTGFFATYRYSLMPDAIGPEGDRYNGVEAKNNAHGSGEIDADSLMYAENTYMNRTWIGGAYDEDGELIDEEEDTTSIIQMNEDSSLAFKPMSVAVGSRYYSSHPIVFNSLLYENIWIKNRDGLNSINHRVEEAHGLDILLNAESDTYNNSMNLEEDLINGKAHFGALQLAVIPRDEEPDEDSEETQVLGPAMKAWHSPLFELDQDYVGTFHINKNINLYTYSEDEETEEGWLPCCSGDFLDISLPDRVKRSPGSVFDCNCFEAPREARFQGG